MFYSLSPRVTSFSTTRLGGCSTGKYASMNINHYCGDDEEHIAQNLNILAQKTGVSPDHIIVPHQANLRIIQSAAKDLGLPVERFFVNIDKCGNTSSACIPVGLAQLDEAGELTPGKTVGLVGFGAGLVYGGCVFEL